MKYKAICFDIDGTLYPKKEMNRRLIRIWIKHPSFCTKYLRMRKNFRKVQDGFETGGNLRDREASLLGCSKQELEEKFYSNLEKEYSKLEPFEGVRQTFEWIKNQGIKIGVFSDFPLYGKLELLGIKDLVDVAICSDDVGFLKPSVHPFKNLLYKLDVESSSVLYVGDDEKKDFAGACANAMDAYLVRDWKSFDSYIKEL